MQFTTDDLRKKWLEFWRNKNHIIIPSAGVLPDNDPTALFHNSGMHPLVPYLCGQTHPAGVRLANAQKCIRTGDIDEVGDATHLTFFEMLGNWSLGDYFKKEQIEWSFEFLTQELKLPVEKLAVSVFSGDDDAPRDTEAADVWKKVGIPESRIAYLGKSDNWWAKGDIGPCGTDTEMFFWTGDEDAPKSFQETHDDPRWVEIWNDVFMTFNRKEDGTLEPLQQKNIDTGMGLERTVAVLNGKKSVYETDAFAEILDKIAKLAGNSSLAKNPLAQTDEANSMRVIADHLRSGSMILADKVAPGNVDQGYILRRLLRRAIRHGRKLGLHGHFTVQIAEVVKQKLGHHYPELVKNWEFIKEELNREEEQFAKTLEKGENILRIRMKETAPHETPPLMDYLSGKEAFDLYQTYGFPLELTIEIAKEEDMTVDIEGFYKEEKLHQQMSRSGSEQKFKGGLGDTSIETTRLHTATHLLHSALKKVLGDHVEQRGSNITPERLRFDFSHGEKMTPEEITEVEKLVNEAIAANVAIKCEETTVAHAKERGAIGLFEDKYGANVKMYSMGDFSTEICGGPHAKTTGELGKFKIKKEEASSRGVRRIKAVLE